MSANTTSKRFSLGLNFSTQQRRRITLVLTVMLVLYWMVAFIGTHIPIPPGVIPRGGDKVLHFLGYSVLGGLLMALRASIGPFHWRSVAGRAGFLAAYGAFDEVTQKLVGRSADVADWCADVLGACFGLMAVVLLVHFSSKYIRPTAVAPPSATSDESPQSLRPNT
jgi:VanZ family protein